MSVEIDTTKVDTFFYDPTWDTPVVQVMEANYSGESSSSQNCFLFSG